MKNKITQLQQGDILLSPVSIIPPNCKPIHDKRGAVLGEGEITGHYHAIEDTDGVQLLEAPDHRRFLVVSKKRPTATLTHQEHKPVTIQPGIYQIGQVREKDWFSEMVRVVRD